MLSNVIFWCIVLIGVPLVIVIFAALFVGRKADEDMEHYIKELKNE
jgi:hypothetical protein